MASIAEIREKYPQYNDMSDTALADAMHAKFYADMPREEFNSKIGLKQAQTPTNDQSFLSNVASGLSTSYTDTTNGLAQLGLGGGAKAANAIGMSSVSRALSGGLDSLNNKISADRIQSEQVRGSAGGLIGKVVGDTLQMALPAGKIAAGVRAVSAAPKLAAAAPYIADIVSSAGFNAVQPVLGEESRAENAAVGGIGAGVGRGIVDKAGAFVRSAKDPLVAAADRLGIPVGVAEISKSPLLRYATTAADNLSLTNPRQRQLQDFYRATSRTFGENTGDLSQDTFGSAAQRIGGQFGNAYSKGINNAEELVRKLDTYGHNESKTLMSDQASGLNNIIEEIAAKVEGNTISPKAAENLNKTVRGMTRQAYKGDDSVMANSLSGVSNTLDDAVMSGLSRAEQASLKQARVQYASMKTVEPLAANGGEVSPARLAQAVARETRGKLQNAGELGIIAQISGKYLKNLAPDSGTATRSFLYDLIRRNPVTAGLAGASAAPFAAAPMAATVGGATAFSELMHSPAIRKLLAGAAQITPYTAPQYTIPTLASFYNR